MDNPEQRMNYWWRLQRDCPKCNTTDIPICKFFYNADGGFRIQFLCVTCANEFYWDLNPFKLAAEAHNKDDYESFIRTPDCVKEAV